MNLYDKIFVIIVYYNTNFNKSETFNSILSNCDKRLKGMVYDNSRISQNIDNLSKIGDFAYFHNPLNPGLAIAYNEAVNQAAALGYNWILLLDQDTYLTKEYFKALENTMFDLDESIVAFTPVVKSFKDRKAIISPSRIRIGGFEPLNYFSYGKQVKKISAINSGTVIKGTFIESIGGFNVNYSLDMLDHWYFREIYRREKFIFLLNCEIYQNLSVNGDFEKNIPFSRYQKSLLAEKAFFNTDNFKQLCFHKLRLIYRLIKQSKFTDKSYFNYTLKNIFNFDTNKKY